MEKMNRTILKSAWPAFVHANQIEENYSMMFRYLGNAGHADMRIVLFIFSITPRSYVIPLGASNLTVPGIFPPKFKP